MKDLTRMFSEDHLKLKHPSGLIIVGPSASGKTVAFYNILKNIDKVYSEKIRKVYVVYQQWQALYDKIKTLPLDSEFVSDISTVDSLNLKNSLLFLDDHITVFETPKYASWLNRIFTQVIHHQRVSVIVTLQHLYVKQLRLTSLNAHGLLYFRNVRDASIISKLNSQCYPTKEQFLQTAYNLAVRKQWGCLYIDFQPRTPDILRVRNGMFWTPDLEIYVSDEDAASISK